MCTRNYTRSEEFGGRKILRLYRRSNGRPSLVIRKQIPLITANQKIDEHRHSQAFTNRLKLVRCGLGRNQASDARVPGVLIPRFSLIDRPPNARKSAKTAAKATAAAVRSHLGIVTVIVPMIIFSMCEAKGSKLEAKS